MADAKKIAFKDGYKTITLDGDLYDPKGSIRGGYNENRHIIEKTLEFREIKERVMKASKDLDAISQQVTKGKELEIVKSQLIAKKEELEHRKQLLEEEEKAKGEGSLESQIKFIIEQITQEKSNINKSTQEIKDYQIELDKIETTIKGSKGGKTSIQTLVQDNIKLTKSEIDNLKKETEKLKKEVQKRIIQIEKGEVDCTNCIKALSESKTHIKELYEKLNELKKGKENLELKIDIEKRGLNELEAKLISSDIVEKELAETRERISKTVQDKITELNTLGSLLKVQAGEYEERIRLVNVLKSENAFIESEESRFGVEESEYDFDIMNIKELSDQAGKLKREMDKLKKMINVHIDEIGDAIEKQYESLLGKKKIVQKDKERLIKTIDELDTRRKTALNEVWSQVSTDFGTIFHTLFPAANSKIILVNSEDITEGINFQVSFKGVIKESLRELSGGQGTLLALSYVLALLKYKPAPLYILDEIDAALDISHTQNIGVMIRQQFPQSQFFIVSLKEGMFNNANVLYKVSLVNGGSKVDRICLRESNKENENNENRLYKIG